MTKWPKTWIRLMAEMAWLGFLPTEREEAAIRLLDALYQIGALKEPPKPREWWICEVCGSGYVARHKNDRTVNCRDNNHEWIHVREVEEE